VLAAPFRVQAVIKNKRKKTRTVRGNESHGKGRIGTRHRSALQHPARRHTARSGALLALSTSVQVAHSGAFRVKEAERSVPPLPNAGKHRKHPGGRGNSGGQHHHRILFDK
jgi:hypothetical protein